MGFIRIDLPNEDVNSPSSQLVNVDDIQRVTLEKIQGSPNPDYWEVRIYLSGSTLNESYLIVPMLAAGPVEADVRALFEQYADLIGYSRVSSAT